MPPSGVSESTVESVALDWLASLGWTVLHGPDIAPDTPAAERVDYSEVVLNNRLRSALVQLNPNRPDDALDDALRRLTRPVGATLEARNREFHRMAVGGLDVEYPDTDGRVRGDKVRVLDFDPQRTGQNRPFVDGSKPAISGDPRQGVEFYFTASCRRKAVWTLVRQLLGPHLSTWA